ncbi:L-2-hydroxyglutarate oxidase [uncultured Paludibaculum sp.]|uniref:L-2-hydroxyglutarate oxidase n=1 Tax=uncultured Paludibaculum sp. TaxID=1765020 RepID=UPI002AAAA59D|nr:L-2-hydroxyglutarate oxidase [uncultured Paludibaculum sp.]
MSEPHILVIGGGAVGLASAVRILQRLPGAQLTLLEKEEGVGRHQTGNNSGVMHCGLAYRPGTAKARLAVRGIRQLTEYCQEKGIRHDVCGKLVVASKEEQIPRLQNLLERGTANGLKGLEILDRPRMRELEPHVGGLAGLHVPEEGIVDYPRVCETLAADIKALGGAVECGAGVRSLTHRGDEWIAQTPRGEFRGGYIVSCAGLQADRVAKLAGERPSVKIVPFRGDYYKLKPEREYLVRNLIYPVADPAFPFLGVHFTRMIAGGIEAGPNAVLSLKREGYTRTSFDLRDAADALAFIGLWRFLGKHFSMCVAELRRAFSKELFCASLQTLVPEVQPDDLVEAGAGVRAQAMKPEGSLVEDFEIIARQRAVHVLNAPSPAATASLAIGEEVADRLCTVVQGG